VAQQERLADFGSRPVQHSTPDPEGIGGGYQEATAGSVKFVDTRQYPPNAWTCGVTVKMPLRTAVFGKVSAERAAEIASNVLTDASSITMHSRSSWMQALFCKQLGKDMNKIFKYAYECLGASASAQ
jgi:hypothetical protein